MLNENKYLFRFMIDNAYRFVLINTHGKDDYDTVEYEINNYIEDHEDELYSLDDLLNSICEVTWDWTEVFFFD